MARLRRLYAPNVPQLAQVTFAEPLAAVSDPTPSDKLQLLSDWLLDGVVQHQVALHGWVVLNDRIALLATTREAGDLSRLIQAVGRRFATRLRHGRVFADRYRSALIQPGRWVLPAMIWLDRLPVQLHYVDQPAMWPWSSAAAHIGAARADTRIGPEHDHPDFWREGNTPFDRQARFSERLGSGLPETQTQQLEKALFGQWALGDEEFLARIQPQVSRRTAPAPRGRPRKTAKGDSKTEA